MPYFLGQRSRERLAGVHPDLIVLVSTAIRLTTVDFSVIEGIRSPQRQQQLYEAGASWTLNSRHLTGHAVDLAPWVDGEVRWDWPLFDRIADAVKEASKITRIPFIWGGDWTVRDGPHFELPREHYP